MLRELLRRLMLPAFVVFKSFKIMVNYERVLTHQRHLEIPTNSELSELWFFNIFEMRGAQVKDFAFDNAQGHDDIADFLREPVILVSYYII